MTAHRRWGGVASGTRRGETHDLRVPGPARRGPPCRARPNGSRRGEPDIRANRGGRARIVGLRQGASASQARGSGRLLAVRQRSTSIPDFRSPVGLPGPLASKAVTRHRRASDMRFRSRRGRPTPPRDRTGCGRTPWPGTALRASTRNSHGRQSGMLRRHRRHHHLAARGSSSPASGRRPRRGRAAPPGRAGCWGFP